MTTASITIPYPTTGSFGVIVKNSVGVTVYSGTQSTATFSVPGLLSGDYIAYITYDGNTVGYCFNVTDCVCAPTPIGTIVRSGTPPSILYSLLLTFDLSGGFPNCPFDIYLNDGVMPRTITISSLADFTSNVGSMYTRKILIFGDRVQYQVSNASATCTAMTSLVYSCHAVPISQVAVTLVETSPSVWVLRLTFTGCGASCHGFTVNYQQNYVPRLVTPDLGSVTLTIDCGALPFVYDVPLSPSATFVSAPARMAYLVNSIDCCGNVFPGAVLGY